MLVFFTSLEPHVLLVTYLIGLLAISKIEDSELSFLVYSLNGITFQLGCRKPPHLALFYSYNISMILLTILALIFAFFADDTSLFFIVENPDAAAELINNDINKISTWAGKLLVKFNPGKNELFVVNKKINKPVHPPIFMLNEQIKEVKFH